MTKGNIKIAMLLDNPFEHDNRVFMEANVLSGKYDLTLFAVKSERSPEEETVNKIKVRRVFTNDIYKYSGRKSFKGFAGQLLKEGFNIIHCHDPLMLEIGAWAKKLDKEIKVIYDSHELFHSWPLNVSGMGLTNFIKPYIVRKLRVAQEKRDANYIDALITVNDSLAGILKKYFRLSSEPVVLRNAPYKEPLVSGGNILRKRFNIPANRKILVFIGMKIFPKLLNLENIIDEFANSEDYSVVFISTVDSYQQYFKDYVAARGINNVFFHPAVQMNEIIPYLSDCDVGLVPTWNKKDLSYWYALDNKLFNYVSAGIPILSTAQPEYKNIVEQYNVGVCINPDTSSTAYIDGMKEIIASYAKYKANVLKAREILNWENESVKLLVLYEKLINK